MPRENVAKASYVMPAKPLLPFLVNCFISNCLSYPNEMCLNKSSSFGWKGYILLSKFLKEGYIFSPNYSKFVLHMNKHGTNILLKCPRVLVPNHINN